MVSVSITFTKKSTHAKLEKVLHAIACALGQYAQTKIDHTYNGKTGTITITLVEEGAKPAEVGLKVALEMFGVVTLGLEPVIKSV